MNQFIEIEDKNDDYGKALENLKQDYNSSLRALKNNINLEKVQSFKKTYQKKKSKERKSFLIPFRVENNLKNNSMLYFQNNLKQNMKKEICPKMKRIPTPLSLDTTKEKETMSSNDLNLVVDKKLNSNIERKGSERNKGRRPSLVLFHQPLKILFYLYGLDTIKSIEQKIIKNQIRKLSNTPESKSEVIVFETDNDELLYHQDFLSFSKFYFVTLTLKNHINMGYRYIFIKKIKKLLTNSSVCNIGEEKSDEKSSFEIISENNNDKNRDSNNFENKILNLSDDSKTSSEFSLNNDESYSGNSFNNNSKKLLSLSKEEDDDENNTSLNFDNKTNFKLDKRPNSEYLEYLDIIEISSKEISQFLLFSAFILELDSIDGFNRDIFTILKLYERGFIENDKEFLYFNFYNFLNSIDYIMIHNYYQRISDSKEFNDKLKMYLNILALKLKQLDSEGKGMRRKFRIFKSMKIDAVPEELKTAIKERRSPKIKKTLSNKSLFLFKNSLIIDEKNLLNNSLYNYLNSRKNKEQEGNPLKINILNLYKKYKKTTKDPVQIIEEIAVNICLFILKKSLHKIQPEIITQKLLMNLSNTPEFQQIKELVAELQVIDLKYLLNINDEHKICFWLNIFNFLMVFAVIYRKEILLTYYEWHKFKKNAYFNIGGINFSLYEIETNILRNNYMAKKLFSEIIDFPKGDSRNKFKIEYDIRYLNFAISEPMTSSFKLQLYFPHTIEKQILKNTIDYFNSRIIIDGKNILVKIPEYLSWVDDNFLENLNYYKPVINNDVFDFIRKNQDKVEFIKHDWSLNFSDSIV